MDFYLTKLILDNTFHQWELPEPVIGNANALIRVLLNNTLIVAQIEKRYSWSAYVIDLPKFLGDKDRGYFNVNVESTFP